MASLSLRNVTFIAHTPLFQNLSLVIGEGDRLGLVAANGAGKSTLLKCLAGLMEPSAGDIVRSRGLRVALVEQDVPDSLLDVSLHDVLLDALPAGRAGKPAMARRHGARRVRDAGRSARSADACAERRLAAAGADRTRLDHAAGPAASRRAHQPPRSRKAVQARGLDQQCGLHGAHRGGEPRPRLPRCLHHENAVPAAGGIDLLRASLSPRAGAARRARCSGADAARKDPARGEAPAPERIGAAQCRHQQRQRCGAGEIGADQAPRRCAGAGRPRRAQGAAGRDQARQSRHPCARARGAGECHGAGAGRAQALCDSKARSRSRRPHRRARPQRRRQVAACSPAA